jgi:signal transduction histidine kinase
MRCPKVFLFFSFLFAFLSSKGEDQITWVQQEVLQKNGLYLNYGFVTEPKTFGIVFNNQTKEEKTYYLKLNNPHINQIIVRNKEKDTLYLTGDRFLFNSRAVYFWEFVFPIRIHPNSTDSIQFQIDKKGENLVFHALLSTPQDFQKIRDAHLYFYSVFISVSLFLFFLFVFFGFYKKEVKHFILALFIFTSAGWALNERGIFFQYIWPNNIDLQSRLDTFFATPSLGLLLFTLYLNTIYKELIGKKLKFVMALFLSFLVARTFVVFFYPGLMNDIALKLIILRISNFIMIFLIMFIISSLIPFIRKRIFFLDTIGFILYFFFILKLLLKQINLDFTLSYRYHGFAYPLFQNLTVGIFALSNFVKYRADKKRNALLEKNAAVTKEKEISDKIIEVQESERERIGKNIHDQLGGLLAVAKIKLQILKLKQNDEELDQNIDQIITIIDRSSDEMYNVVDELVPPMMEGKSFDEIIQSRIELFEKNSDIKFDTNISPIFIDPKLVLKFYRIIAELISNSLKHAKCNKIIIQLIKNEKGYTISYTDNGIGFNQNHIRSHGLNNIESRVKFLNGTIEFYSVPGNTHYTIQLPFQEYEK